MESKTKFAEILAKTNPENGEVTLFIGNEDWGPVVTGKNLAEAKTKMEEAFALAMISNTFCHAESGKMKEKVADGKMEIDKVRHTLEVSL